MTTTHTSVIEQHINELLKTAKPPTPHCYLCCLPIDATKPYAQIIEYQGKWVAGLMETDRMSMLGDRPIKCHTNKKSK